MAKNNYIERNTSGQVARLFPVSSKLFRVFLPRCNIYIYIHIYIYIYIYITPWQKDPKQLGAKGEKESYMKSKAAVSYGNDNDNDGDDDFDGYQKRKT